MDTLVGMRTLVAAVETGSFTAASERLKISKALVSKYIGEIELDLGVRLFNRSTRRLALTDEGRIFYERALPLLEEYEELVDQVVGHQTTPRGRLRISVSVTFGEMKLSPVICLFQQRYPDIEIEIQLTDRRIDMLEEGVDVAIRIGPVDDSFLVARKINRYPLVLCAAPEYLRQAGRPKSPQDVAEHKCIIDSNFRIGKHWPIVDSHGHEHIIRVRSSISANSPRAVREIAIAGGGLALIPRFIVEDCLTDGRLERVLPECRTLEFGLHAIYLQRRYLSRKIRCFIEFLVDQFSDQQSV